MFCKNILLVASATLVVLSQAFPANSSPSNLESKYAKLKAQNPFPAKEPYIHVDGGKVSDSTIEARVILDSIISLLGTPKNAARDASGASCSNDVECQTNNAIFSIDLDDFIENYRNKGLNSPPLIYDSDGCSVPPEVAKIFKIDKDFPYGYEFLNSCYRHDFGYRNYKNQNRFTAPNREFLDDRFQVDLLAQCRSQFPKADIFHPDQLFNRKWCDTVAKVYYKFVRLCGAGNCKIENVKKLFGEIVH
ncbi:uncharacterized protein DFL_008358 [Arthrobotrys flagrans]|uniref:Uncharacterized protein n=1 Tax=Arthrobotrys flagrans TaxID=97331 RepID=A0A436ZNH7_ARTFL|nr:hypothetical protein DFL_008358 [Arthrobotrys flagrans]